MRCFNTSIKDWENFILGKRHYLLTLDENVREGYIRCMVPNSVSADLCVTDIVRLHCYSSYIYVVTAEIERIWL